MQFLRWLKKSSRDSGPKLELGRRGERAAAKFLKRHGFNVLVRGFRSRNGEIDIVCRHKDTLVFVEVKTRRSEDFGAPSEAVGSVKQRHMSKVIMLPRCGCFKGWLIRRYQGACGRWVECIARARG